MNNIILKSILLLSLSLPANTMLFAQVTIGSEKEAVSGSLLQIKEFETNDSRSDGQSNSSKGLGMPRVLLQSVDGDLGLSMGQAAGSLEKNAHIGLTIYNPSDICAAIAAGTYVWDGNMWQYLGGTAKRRDQSSFDEETGILTDFEGNQYTTKVFGTKRWMTQNLRAIRKPDGSCIAPVDGVRFNPGKDNTTMTLAQIAVMGALPVGNVAYKENGVQKNMTNEAFASMYGLAYTWSQAMVACPKGWHLATAQDWSDLGKTLGTDNLGAKLRANPRTIYTPNDSGSNYVWGNTDPTNPAVTPSGFNAIPSGWVRDNGTTAAAFGAYIYWWTATSGRYFVAYYYSPGTSVFDGGNLNFRFFVRCVKD